MVLKLDLENAYDRLEWDFIKEYLMFLKFLVSLVSFILNCISSTRIYILSNGGKLESFLPSTGIRQVDPMSLYIFILCLEYFSIMVEKEVREGTCKGIQPMRGSVSFSHLFFANEIILMGKADKDTCEAMKRTLDSFYSWSGQSINSMKSKIIFSKNTSDQMRTKIRIRMILEELEDIGRYLGFPMDISTSRT